MANIDIKELLESGVHFGHQARRWNPKMKKFIYTQRGGVHIIDLFETAKYLQQAVDFAEKVAVNGGKILFVSTKKQAKSIVKEEAEKAGQPYINERWLGGMLTNFRTIRERIKRLKDIEAKEAGGDLAKFTKKEAALILEEKERLQNIFEGVKEMDALPAAIYIVDITKEDIAVAEATKLGIPVIAMVDTNADPDSVDYPIPANDDAVKSIKTVTGLIAGAVTGGRAAFDANQEKQRIAAEKAEAVEKAKEAKEA